MKKFFLVLYLSLVSVFAFSQWTVQSPLPTGNSISAVYYTDSNTGYSLGELGANIKTRNGVTA